MTSCYLANLWCFLLLFVLVPHRSWSQGLEKSSQASSYYYLKQNGGYEYGFNTDTGMQGAQRADQANEVTGHYMYYEKGVPFMVKYRAGVHGFQPEIIPAEKLLGGNFAERKHSTYSSQDNALNARDIRTTALTEPVLSNYRLTQTQQLAATPKVAAYNIGTDKTLKFVQDALQTMQTQPMHLSFSDLGQIQHPAGPFGTTTSRPTTILQSVSRNDVQDINNLQSADSKQPYSFNYNGDQSSRSETADQSGNVIGSYSYYDEAGYHDVSYKASDDTGFVILGRNSQTQLQSPSAPARSTASTRQFYRPNSLDTFNYRILSDSRITSNSLDERNLGKRSLRSTSTATTADGRNTGKRSLRKFRRYSKW